MRRGRDEASSSEDEPVSKRRRGDEEPPPFLALLDRATLGIRDGQASIGTGPPPPSRLPRDARDPRDPPGRPSGAPGDIPDPKRWYVDEVGYIRDRETGELLPGEELRMPYHPMALAMEERELQRWYEEDEDYAFAKLQTGLNHRSVVLVFLRRFPAAPLPRRCKRARPSSACGPRRA